MHGLTRFDTWARCRRFAMALLSNLVRSGLLDEAMLVQSHLHGAE